LNWLLQDGEYQIVGGDEEAAFGGTLGDDAAELGGQFLCGDAGVEGGIEGFEDLADLLGRFVDEFQAVMDDAGVAP